MNRRSPNASLAASPLLIGAITILVTLVAVVLAYNANDGLPFVPTYDVAAEVRDAAELVPGNEVRIGGRRAGTVTAITAIRRPGGHGARLELKLDQRLEPLPVDSRLTVRPRSMLGLKYVEIVPGRAERGIPAGGTIPVSRSRPTVDVDEVLDDLDAPTRADLVGLVGEAGGGLAGRGTDLNAGLQATEPVFRHLESVARTLARPQTRLGRFVRGAQATMGGLAPVAPVLVDLLDAASTTLRALEVVGQDVDALLVAAPGAFSSSARSAARIRPVLADAAGLVRELRPGVRLLPGTTRRLARLARRAGPTLQRADGLVADLDGTLDALRGLVRDPATPAAVRRLTAVVASLGPTLEWAAPFQTRCNYLGVWTRNVASTVSEGDEHGTWFRFAPVHQADEQAQSAEPAAALHVTPYPQTGQDGECEAGNEPYAPGQAIGSPPTREPGFTDTTAPPPGVRTR